MDDIWLSTGWDLHMGAQGYVQQLGGSYLSVDLVSRKCYHFITVEQSRPSGSQGLGGVCGIQSDTGKGWLSVLKRDGRQYFLFLLPRREKWEGEGVVHLPQGWRRGCESLFLVLHHRHGRMGEKLHHPLYRARGQANIPTGMLELEGHNQKCEEERRDSWASGCPPRPLALSVDVLFLLNKSQRAHALFVEEQDTAGCCVPCLKPLL